MTGLREMIRRELARRDEGNDLSPALWFVVDDRNAAAMTDVEVATKAIIAAADAPRETVGRERTPVVAVTSGIQGAVEAALRAAYPRRWIIFHRIVTPGKWPDDDVDPKLLPAEPPARIEDDGVERPAVVLR
jgi:hypothetical protein